MGESGKEVGLFSVLPEGGSAQLLQVNLRFAQFFYFNGKVVYSNHTQPKMAHYQQAWYQTNKAHLARPLVHWVNLTNKLQIVGLTHTSHSGPILILDLNAYREGLYVSQPHLFAARLPLSHRRAQQLADLVLVGLTGEGLLEQTVVLQAQTGSIIMEKYLGAEEEFCIYDHRCVLAVSETMQMELLPKDSESKIAKFKGPGWVFFETGGKKEEGRNRLPIFVGLVVFYLCLMVL